MQQDCRAQTCHLCCAGAVLPPTSSGGGEFAPPLASEHISSSAWHATRSQRLRSGSTPDIFKEEIMEIESQRHEQIRPAESSTASNVLLHWTVAIVFMTALIGGAALFF